METTNGGKSIVKVGLPAAPTTLDPFTGDANFAMHTLYESLCSFDGFGSGAQFKNVGAKSYKSVSDDGCTWEFELYDNIYDDNGNRITSNDIAFWYKKAYEASNDAAMNLSSAPEVIDDTHFRITLTSNRLGLLQSVAGMITLVSEKSYESQDFSIKPATTAQYKVAEFVPGSSLTLIKNEDYWQKDTSAVMYAANVDVIKFSFITEAAQLAIALETGDIDVASGVANTEVDRFMEGGSEADKYTTYSRDGHVIYCLLPNCDATNGIFANNLALRKAVYYAIDRNAVMQAMLGGYGTVLHQFASPCYPDYLTKWDKQEYFDYNLDTAKKYLDEAGYKAGDLNLKVAVVSQNSTIAEIVQACLSQIGIDVTIDAVDSGLWSTIKYDSKSWDMIIETKGDSMYNINVNRVVFDQDQNGGTSCNFIKDDKLQELLSNCINNGQDGLTDNNLDAYYDYLNENAYGYGLYTTKSFYVAVKGIEMYTDAQDQLVPGNFTYPDDFLASHTTSDY